MDYIIKRMSKEHIKAVSTLEKLCFPLPWTEQQITLEVYNPDAYYYVLCLVDCDILNEDLLTPSSDYVVGYGGFINIAQEGHIMDIAVLNSYRNMGLGGILLAHLISIACDLSLENMTLECRESNTAARRLYEKYDFKFSGIRPNYYENQENAAIYWKKL